MKALALALMFVDLSATPVFADYHTVLTGVRIQLSTTTIEGRREVAATMNANGFIAESPSNKQQSVPSTVLEGYIARLNTDPEVTITSTTRPGELGERWVSFYYRDELVRLTYPRPGLARTKTIQGLFIPIKIITKIERLPSPFDGSAGMGEPFLVLPWQAKLLSSGPPLYSCDASGEGQSVAWVSYNPEVGEKELTPFCAVLQDYSAIAPLVKKGKVFAISYPYD